MAHFSWSQSLVLLAAALCFFGACDAVTSTKPPPTTANVTTAAPTTINMTTAASNMTTAPSNMTTAPSNMTTAASNMTTAASNMTTAPSNMTTAASNMTTAASNMTTAASNMTTAASNMTTSNMTTAPSNMTTAPSNMTTASSEMTTPHTMTTPVPEHMWKVQDKNNKTCMLMGFGGIITYKHTSHQIPISASDVKSSCASANSAQFVVEFKDGDMGTNLWQLVLNFTTTKSSFKLHEVSVNLYLPSKIVVYGKSELDLFDVPFGDYYYCNNFNVSAHPFNVNLTKPTLQPFVQKTKGGDNLGDISSCSNGSSGNKTNIIIGVVVAVIVLIAAIVVTYFVVKRRGKPSDPPYARVQ